MSDHAPPACPACGAGGLETIFERAGVPAVCNALMRSREEALAVPRGDLRLALCAACGAVANTAFDAALVPYDARYENPLHVSQRFRAYARELAQGLAEDLGREGARAVEVGCGDGWFLGELCAAGGFEGVGLDPGCDPAAAPTPKRGNLRLLRCDLADAPPDLHADLVVCRHVLEHLPDPRAALVSMRALLDPDGAGQVYVEVPEGGRTFVGAGVWDLLYEHCVYYTASALERVLAYAGFVVEWSGVGYGGQFLSAKALRAGANPAPTLPAQLEDHVTRVRGFAQHFGETVERAGRVLADALAGSAPVCLWGTGTKGVMYLNTVPGTEGIACAVDINPRKQGGFVCGSGHRIVAPEALRELCPGTVLLMNPLYREEVRAQLSALGLAPAIIAA